MFVIVHGLSRFGLLAAEEQVKKHQGACFGHFVVHRRLDDGNQLPSLVAAGYSLVIPFLMIPSPPSYVY